MNIKGAPVKMPESSMAVKHTALVALASLFVLGANAATAVEYANSVRAGYVVSPVGTVGTVEYENMFSRRFSLGARLGYIDYDYEHGSYRETGHGPGAEFLARFYLQGPGHRGIHIGVGVGVWKFVVAWTDPTGFMTSGRDTRAPLLNANLSLGWKTPLGRDRVYIDPNLVIGSYVGCTGPTYRCSGIINFRGYAAAGLSVGVNF